MKPVQPAVVQVQAKGVAFMTSLDKKYFFFTCLALLCVITSGWITIAMGPTYTALCDQIHHLNDQIIFEYKLYDIVHTAQPFWTKCMHLGTLFFYTKGNPWPKGLYLISWLVHLVFGNTTFITEISSLIIFLTLLIISLFFFVRFYFNSRVAFCACLILVCFPGIIEYAQGYGLDFPLTAWVCLCMYLLAKTQFFTSKIVNV